MTNIYIKSFVYRVPGSPIGSQVNENKTNIKYHKNKGYLANRQRCLSINDLPSLNATNAGVPRGSILIPILFLMLSAISQMKSK